MEKENYDEIAKRLIKEFKQGLEDGKFLIGIELTILTLLLEKGVFTPEEFKTVSEKYKSLLIKK